MKWNVGWGAISKCNMKCAFCYSKQCRRGFDDLGYNDWVKFIDQNHSKIDAINYGTGESTLSADWFKLIAYIRNNYPTIKQALTTNGYLSCAVKNEENLRMFIHAIDEVDISLDFADKASHNNFRGQPMAYDWVIETLQICNRYQKQVTIVFLGSNLTTSKENIDGLFSIAKKYSTILRMNLYRPTEGVNSFSRQFIIDRERLLETITYISQKYSVLSIGDAYLSPILTGNARPDPSGNVSIRILSDGTITPSTYLISENYSVANILQDNVLQRLEDEDALRKIITIHIPVTCQKCIYRTQCQGGVYDRRYLWFGTLDKKDPYCTGPYQELISPTIELTNKEFTSVHDKYLPTIFFRP